MGCSSSRDLDAYKQRQHSFPSDSAHLVALTSSTYGFLRVDSQKQSDDAKEADPVNQMYQKMMNLDEPGSKLPQSWSEVSSVLSQLKTEAQSNASGPARLGGRTEPETIDVSELLENVDEESLKNLSMEREKKSEIEAKEKPVTQKRDFSVIHTLDEVEKLVNSVPLAEDTGSSSDSEEFVSSGFSMADSKVPSYYQSPQKPSAKVVESARRPDKRFSMNSVMRRARNSAIDKPVSKASKSMSYSMPLTTQGSLNQLKQETSNHHKLGGLDQQKSESALFDPEFLASFKEAFEQLSTGVPSAVSPQYNGRNLTSKSNKMSQSDVQFSTRKVASPNIRSSNHKEPALHPDIRDSGKGTLPGVRPLPPVKPHVTPQLKPVDSKGASKVASPKLQAPSSQEVAEKPVSANRTPAKEPQPPPKKVVEDPLVRFEKRCPPDGEQKVVLYSTSLRGIRKTFEDCNTVRNIVQSFNVDVDERDVSMDSEFRQQLKDLMEKPVPVPRLFIKGRYIGGAEEVLQLHENGTLAKLLQGLPLGNPSKDCDGCGGVRFIPCTDCSGSCKALGQDGNVVRCPDCNENGLVRCPICS